MKHPSYSLKVVLPLALFLALTVVGLISLALSVQQRLHDLHDGMQRQILVDVGRVVRLADEGVSLSTQLLRAEVAHIMAQPVAQRVVLMDEQGRIIAASRMAWVGQRITDVFPELDANQLLRASQNRLPDWQADPDTHRMQAWQSFSLPAADGEVRSFRRGVAHVVYDLNAERERTMRAELWARLPDLVGLLLVFALMGWWLRQHITQPLARLQSTAAAWRQGDWNEPPPAGRLRELSHLAEGLEALRLELTGTWRAIPDPLFELDAEGRYLRVVALRPELLALPADDLIGKTVHEVLPPAAAKVVAQALADAERLGGVWGREMALEVPAGTCWFEISVACKETRPGQPMTFVSMSRDITARKRAEISLLKLNEELEARVQARTQELYQAKQEAELANHSKSEFITRMSHELRTPLNAILGFGQLLEMSLQDARQVNQVKHILDAGRHLLHLIGDILDLARVESGQLSLAIEPVNPASLLKECLDMVQPLAQSRDVTLMPVQGLEAPTSQGLQLLADRMRLRQVMINLLSNAIKFNQVGGRVGVSLVVNGDMAELRVQDTGPGLSEEQQSRLFMPFERLNADQIQVEGTGIGLALSRHLMTLMNGHIGVDSTPGHGAVFWVRVPLAVSPAASPTLNL
jgi:PAS domain S-box-containing protein